MGIDNEGFITIEPRLEYGRGPKNDGTFRPFLEEQAMRRAESYDRIIDEYRKKPWLSRFWMWLKAFPR